MGSSGGGGGGGAGVVDFPIHMKTFHENILGDGAAVALFTDMDRTMNIALGNSPFLGATAYDPGGDIAAYEAAIAGFSTILAGISEASEWSTLFAQAVSDIVISNLVVDDETVLDMAVADIAAIVDRAIADEVIVDEAVADISVLDGVAVADAAVANIADTSDVAGITDAEILLDTAALAASLDDQITNVVLPRFQAGMRDINAVVSSTFVVGQSVIEGFRDRDVAKHESGLRVEAAKVNVNVDLENEKMHLRVKEVNVNKDAQIAGVNVGKDTQVSQMNLVKDTDVARTNIGKDVSVAQLNTGKDVSVSQINVGKDTTLAQINLEKDVKVPQINLDKDVSIATGNLTKDVSVATMNLDKDIKVGGANLVKETSVAQLRISSTDQMIRFLMQKYTWQESYMRVVVEANRIKIVALKEQNDLEIEIDEKDAVWDLEVFQYGGNLLASIGSGVLNPKSTKPSGAQSVIGGAMAGAAAGSTFGPPGAIIGGILGAASGLLG